MEQSVLEGLRRLPLEQREKVVAFVQTLVQNSSPHSTIWEKIEKRIEQASPEVWNKMPADGAEQHDHYLYGAPKK
jgi:hypothetical protein